MIDSNSTYNKSMSSTTAGSANLDAGADRLSVDTAVSAASEFATNAMSKAKDLGGRVSDQVMDTLGSIPEMSRDYAGRIDQHARANPWLHIGLIGAGALALGYFIGKRAAAVPAADSDLKEIYNQ